MILLRAENLNLNFGGVRAIRDLNFSIKENEIVGVIGSTESGKSTLFDIISGINKADKGSLMFDAIDISSFSIEERVRMGISRTFQHSNLFNDLTVKSHIKLGLVNSQDYSLADVLFITENFNRQEDILNERVDELLEIFSLNEYGDVAAKDLSYDLQCKLDIARAVATSPKLLLLDRPTKGISNKDAEQFMYVIEMVNRRFNTAIVIVENDINLIIGICNRICVMEYGTIIACDEPLAIKNNQALMSICMGD